MRLRDGGDGQRGAFVQGLFRLSAVGETARQRPDIGIHGKRRLLRIPFRIAEAFQHLVNLLQADQRVFRRRRDRQKTMNAHGLGVADVGVVKLHLVDALAKGADGAAFVKALQTVITGAGAHLHAGILRAHVTGAAALIALKPGYFRHHRLTDRFFKEFLGLGRVFKLAKQFDVAVGGDGARFLLDAFFKRRHILCREDQRKSQAPRLRRHDRHALGGVIPDLVEYRHEGRGRCCRLVFDGRRGIALDRGAKRRAHHPLEGGGNNFSEVRRLVAGFFQRRDKHDQNAAVQHHIQHIDVRRLRVEDKPVIVAQRRHGARELH